MRVIIEDVVSGIRITPYIGFSKLLPEEVEYDEFRLIMLLILDDIDNILREATPEKEKDG